MVISKSLKYAFVSTMKCGTNSMYEFLVKEHKGSRHGDFHCRDKSFFTPEWFTFTTVRDPYSRAVSIWWSTCKRHKMIMTDRYKFRRKCKYNNLDPNKFVDFMKWVVSVPVNKRQGLIQTQSQWHKDLDYDKVLKIENLASDFNELPFVKTKTMIMPRINSTFKDRLPHDDYLDKEVKKLIVEWAKDDFDRFDYKI